MIEIKLPPGARPGTLVCAFAGWNDGGQAATTALEHLRDAGDSRPVGSMDPEEFYDFQVTRPMVHLVEGITREIRWPENTFFLTRIGGKELMILLGIEPNLKWRTFCDEIVSTAKRLSIPRLVTLGAFLAELPHTRNSPVIGTASDPATADRLGLIRSQYEGPTGVVGVLQSAAAKAGLESVSFWTGVPHYLPAGPNPRSALALLEKASSFLEISVDASSLQGSVSGWETEIGEVVSGNTELSDYVTRLEQLYPESEGAIEMQVPTGDELTRQLEEFLRNASDGD